MSRLPPDRYTFPWGDADSCPCGSNIIFVECCKRGPGKLPYVRLPDLTPPGAKTNFGHPKCYMAPSQNCSHTKSREHYISEAILRRFTHLKVSGMPWQKAGEQKNYPSNALVANILCARHNAALSPIDTLGLKAFDAFTGAADYAVKSSTHGRAEHHLISGEGLELWMYKLLAGIHFGRIAASQGDVLRDTHHFPINELVAAMMQAEIPPRANLWITQGAGPVAKNQIGVAPLIDTPSKRIIGVQVQFGPLRFEATLDTPPLPTAKTVELSSRRRPRVVDFIGIARDSRVVLTWKGLNHEVNRLGIELRS